MTHTYRRRLSAVAAGCAAAGLGLAGAVVAAGPANSLPAPEDQDCPEAFPTSALVKGQPVDGLTVSSGNEADTFTGEVIGVLDDGIATGLDMILVRLTGAEIDRVGGIWAGMSGSPVYAADGRLIGAVSYGLSGGPSAVAGVTPAADMQELLDDPLPIDRALAKRVLLPKALQAQVAADPTTTQAEARSGFTQLALPVAVSTSLTGKRFNQLTKKLRKDNAIFYKTKSAPVSAAAGAESEIFAGSNLAAGISYGDFTAVGTGTTTMVCGDQVVGFGHPMDFTGPASLTLHGADALYVQEDSLGAPFKVANPGAPIGTINQDRMAGIKGILGTLPETTLVRTDVTYGNKNRVGDTYVSAPDYLSTVSLYSNFGAVNKVFDRTGKGTALIKYTIKGETAAGKPFTVNRTNRYADNFDITFAAIWDAAMDIDTVLLNDFTDVTIDDVTWKATLEDVVKEYKIAKVEAKIKGKWKKVTGNSTLLVKPGKKLQLRTTLNSRRNVLPKVTVKSSAVVPKSTKFGREGIVMLGSPVAEGGDFEDFEGPSASSFTALIAALNKAPRNDSFVTDTMLFTPSYDTKSTSTIKRTLSGVTYDSLMIPFVVVPKL